jgi:gliding motility-associated-like protein
MMFMCCCQFSISFAQADLNSGLALYFPFPGDLNDYSGNGHIPIGRNYSFDEDCARSSRNAIYLNGNNSFIEIPSSAALNRTEKITISLWVYPESSNADKPIVFRGKTDGTLKRLAYSVGMTSNGQLTFQMVSPSSCTSFEASATEATPLPVKQWHSVIATFDGVQLSLYRNGNLVAQEQVGFSRLGFCEADMPLLIGAASALDASTFNGRITDLRIYDRVVTADEINHLSITCKAAAGCMPPPTLEISLSTPTSAMVKWTDTRDMNNLVRYDAEYKDSASRDWLFAFQANTPTKSDSITGLVRGRTYDVRIRSNCVSFFGGFIYRQFTVPAQNKCQPPFNLNVVNVSETEAGLQWDVKPDGIGVNVQYLVKGVGTSWVDAAAEITNKSYTITGLTPGTDYEWRIQTACPDGTSDWVLSEFTTQGVSPCRAPFSLLPADISGNSAALTWSSSTLSLSYEVEYREATATQWIRATTSLFGYEIEYIDSLQPLTAYNWRVRAICANGISAWTESSFETTSGNQIPSGIVFISDFSHKADSCAPARVKFSNASIVTSTTIRSSVWNFDDGSFSTDPDPVHSFTKTGNYNVVLTITEDGGRTSTKRRQIAISELELDFATGGDDVTVCSNEPIALKASGGSAYAWSPCAGLNNCNIAEPMVTPGVQERYVVTVTNSNGCIDKDTVLVKYRAPDEPIYIPNAFTPNNDGLNDVFRPMSNARIASFEWKVYDRYGNAIYASTDASGGWNGTAKGKLLPAGSYTYRINIPATGFCPARQLKGTVTLIR